VQAVDDLAASFDEMANSTDAEVGLAVAPVGGSGEILTFGQWTSGAAWSTSKVPLVLAALHEQPAAGITAAMAASITQSDNNAAEQVWESLGEPQTAAQKVDLILRESGDETRVQAERTRAGFSAFGQTIWSLADQAKFMAHTACDSRAKLVLELMGRVEVDQRWGVGGIPDAKIKGGWGPMESGGYLVRQVGLIPTTDGRMVAVALAAEPSSGSFSDGTQSLDAMANWINTHIAQLPSGACA
jgi:hypothetical protein